MSSTLPLRAHNQAPSHADAGHTRLGLGMFVVLLAQLMLVLDATVVTVAIPHIQTDLHFSSAGLSWVLNGYMLAFGGLLLLGGRLGDVFGRLRTFWWGLAIFTVFSFVGGIAVDPTMLIISRALQGVGAAFASPSVLALLTTNAKDEHARHRALGYFAAVSSGGGGLGLLLGGVLTEAISWRWTLFINVPIGLAVLLFVRRLVSETPRRNDKFDIVGSISATLGAVAIVWAFVEAPDYGWGSARVIGGFIIGALLLVVLGFTETRVSHPMLRLELLRNPQRVSVLISTATYFSALMGLFFVLSQVFEEQMGFSPVVAGLAFLPIPGSIFLLSFSGTTPRLVRKFGQAPLILTATTAVTLASLLLLTGMNTHSHYFWAIFIAMLATGLANGIYFMPMTSLALDKVSHEHACSASGLLQTFQQLGGAIGLAIVASVFAAHAGSGLMSGAHAAIVTTVIMYALSRVAALAVVLFGRRVARAAVVTGQ